MTLSNLNTAFRDALARFSSKTAEVVFSVVGTILVLWHLLAPGYVILLDWVPGPHTTFSYDGVSDYLHAPVGLLLYAISHAVPGWVVQKLILVALVFSLFYLPIRFFPWRRYLSAGYFAAMASVFNPFLYERLLSGQWRVVVGYAGLFPLIYYLFGFGRERTFRAATGVFAVLLLIGMWSVHFFTIGVLIVAAFVAFAVYRDVRSRDSDALARLVRSFVGASLLSLSVSLYWIAPLMLRGTPELSAFEETHFAAFATAEDPLVGVMGNVLTLRGFWAEAHAWAAQYAMPGDDPFVFYPAFALFVAIVSVGWRHARRDPDTRLDAGFVAAIAGISVVFAAGISAYFIWSLNHWLLSEVGFWNGFRDTQKWAGVLAFGYALAYGVGASVVTKTFRHGSVWRPLLVAGCLLLPVALAPHLLFGLSGQAVPVSYPASWTAADEAVGDAPRCRAVFLPWHQYYAVGWNGGRLSGNPAGHAFRCETVTGRDTELGEIAPIAGAVAGYADIDRAVTDNDRSASAVDAAIATLQNAGIGYVIVSDDLSGRDLYQTPFLGSSRLSIIYQGEGIAVYRLP